MRPDPFVQRVIGSVGFFSVVLLRLIGLILLVLVLVLVRRAVLILLCVGVGRLRGVRLLIRRLGG